MSHRPVRHALRRLHRAKLRMLPALSGAGIAGLAIAIVSYLLWPTWQQAGASTPDRIPVSVGTTLFNIPARAFRIKVQTHSGPQDRIDLAFLYPSLAPPEAVRHVSIDDIEQGPPPIDRLFLSVVAHGGALAPEQRVRTIYPKYLEAVAMPAGDGLLSRPFKAASPYAGEDLFYAGSFAARCSRDGVTVGMCLAERRAGDADLTFRFPRSWLSDWQSLAGALDKLTADLQHAKS